MSPNSTLKKSDNLKLAIFHKNPSQTMHKPSLKCSRAHSNNSLEPIAANIHQAFTSEGCDFAENRMSIKVFIKTCFVAYKNYFWYQTEAYEV
jgi:hypothetical protein